MLSRPRNVVLIIGIQVASGCAVYYEGSSLHKVPDAQEWKVKKAQLLKNRKLAVINRSIVPGIVVIGRVGPFRDFKDSKVFNEAYDHYKKIIKSTGESESLLPPDQIKALADGWTTITYGGSPQFVFSMSRAFVPSGNADEIQFSSKLGTSLLGTREDLVSATATIEFPFFVIDSLLCRDDETSLDCEKSYSWGLYDVYTGKEVNKELVIKEDGAAIDINTYKLIGNNEGG